MPKKEKDETYQLIEVPTQTTLAVKTPEGEVWDINRAIVELLNKVDEMLEQLK